jgi:hypothetical protein
MIGHGNSIEEHNESGQPPFMTISFNTCASHLFLIFFFMLSSFFTVS